MSMVQFHLPAPWRVIPAGLGAALKTDGSVRSRVEFDSLALLQIVVDIQISPS